MTNATSSHAARPRGLKLLLSLPRLTMADLKLRPGERHAQWAERLRAAAIFDGRFPRPFAIGLHEQLLERLNRDRCEVRTLGYLLAGYAGSRLYQALAHPCSQRHDIDGHPVGPVDEAHRQFALELLTRRAEAASARR